MIKYVSASISENGTVKGTKGDQTGKEIKIVNPYTHKLGWRRFRHPDPEIRKITGIRAKQIADNDNYGYGQPDRNTGYAATKAAGWDPTKVKTKVNLDCSESVRTCIACALKKDISDFNTSSEPAALLKLGFEEVKDGSELHGDILCTPSKGHTVIVIDTAVSTVEKNATTAIAYFPKYTGSSSSITEALRAVGETDVSYSRRKKIAAANDIVSYQGTASQNLLMVKLLKAGTLKKA